MLQQLRDRLQALLEEAEPLAGDQLVANERICLQLWRQWKHYHGSGRFSSEGMDSMVAPSLAPGADRLTRTRLGFKTRPV